MRIKKMVTGTLVAAAIMSSTLCFGASANSYPDAGSWELYCNPYTSRIEKDINLNYYSGGYKAEITAKGNGGSSNYVTIYQKGTRKVIITEEEQPCNTFFSGTTYTDGDGVMYAPFTVELSYGSLSSGTVYNNGTIKLSNMF